MMTQYRWDQLNQQQLGYFYMAGSWTPYLCRFRKFYEKHIKEKKRFEIFLTHWIIDHTDTRKLRAMSSINRRWRQTLTILDDLYSAATGVTFNVWRQRSWCSNLVTRSCLMMIKSHRFQGHRGAYKSASNLANTCHSPPSTTAGQLLYISKTSLS